MSHPIFSGSYRPDDCQFLLTPIEPQFLDVEEKEQQIQSGRAHYSEMIHRESAPSERYIALFEGLCERYAMRMAIETRQLARQISCACKGSGPIVLVSLVRAGTPVGVLLKRALEAYEARGCLHFSVSIIRDRGIDEVALDHIQSEFGVAGHQIVFVDAWTAKGTITGELHRSLERYNRARPAERHIQPRLAVLSDIGGTADYAATCEDYAIPSGVLNATVSGLVSRSVLNDQIRPGEFHGTVLYQDLAPWDRTREFVDFISRRFAWVDSQMEPLRSDELAAQRQAMRSMLEIIQREQGVSDINHVKPGIAEATRVMLRRVPAALFVKDRAHPDVEHLLLLAEEKSVPVEVDRRLPFQAVSLIKRMQQREVA